MAAHGRYNFVVFSDDWGRHPSSCQHLFRHLGREHRVLWVNTIGMRSARADRFTVARGLDKFRQWAAPLRQVDENLWVYSPAMLPAAGEGFAGRWNSRWVAQRLRRLLGRFGMRAPVLFTSVPNAADYVGQLDERTLAYYITDDYRHWPGTNARAIAAQDELLTRRADLLLPCGQALAQGRRPTGHLELLPHAVDLEHFARVDEPLPEPPELTHLPHPRLCFFGLIYEKLDLELLERLARQDARRQLVLIGPVKTDATRLASLPNVHLLGARPYESLPQYLRHMDVLLLPYRLDEQIRRSAPLKIRECLATGKPIVAVDVPDLRRYDGLIRLAGDADGYLAACAAACRQRGPEPRRAREALAGQTWQARARQVEDALERVTRGRSCSVASPAIRVEQARDGQAWDRYVAACADGSLWHRWGWRQAMCGAYELSCPYLLARRGPRIVGVLPLALQTSAAFGRHLVSLPWLDHAGILADDEQARTALLHAAQAHAAESGANLVLRDLHPADAPQTRTDKLVMTLPLPRASEQLWNALGSKVRNQVRKAQKARLRTDWAGTEAIGDFYRVYSTNMRDLGSPPHSLEFFRQVFAALGEAARLMIVRHQGRAVAAALVLRDGRSWQVPWASSLREFNPLCPNHLMYWAILADACGRTGAFCFGRSSADSGTFKFKRQWGAQPQQLYWHTYLVEPAGPVEHGGEGGRAVSLVQRAWQHIPASLARCVGPHIIRSVA